MNAPYGRSSWSSSFSIAGRNFEYGGNEATDFVPRDDAADRDEGALVRQDRRRRAGEAVIVNERLARELFGSEDPVGRRLTRIPRGCRMCPANRPCGSWAFITDFRKGGEFEPAANFAFLPQQSRRELRRHPRAALATRAGQAGLGADFEERMIARLQQGAPSGRSEPNPSRGPDRRCFAPGRPRSPAGRSSRRSS